MTHDCRRPSSGQHLLAWLIVLYTLLSAGVAHAAVEPITANDAYDYCRASAVNTDPWQPGTALAQPGRWWNSKRYGTGWDLVYDDDRKKLKVFFYTFDDKGHSIWLTTPMTAISEDGLNWKADLRKYRRDNTFDVVGEVAFRFFRDDPSRLAARWRWNAITNTALQPVTGSNECLADMTRLNPTYYSGQSAPITKQWFDDGKALATDPSATSVFSGYWAKGSTVPTSADVLPGMVMTVMQTSLGPTVGYFGEAAVLLTFDTPPANIPNTGHRDEPIFVQAQRVPLLPSLPLTSDTFNLYYHYGVGYPNGYAVTDCEFSTNTPCNNNQLIGTYTREFKATKNYREVDARFFVDSTKIGTNRNVLNPWQASFPSYLSSDLSLGLGEGGAYTRSSKLQEISVNKYVCQVEVPPPSPQIGYCGVWVHWAGNGIGKPWKRDLSTLKYSEAPLSTADFGMLESALAHGDRVQFELWSGTPGEPGAQMLDRTPEVRAVGPTPSETGAIQVPAAAVLSNLDDLPSHEANVGALPGQADVSGGAGVYTVPIEVPPGRNGMQPSVALNYSSRGGNGVAGLGWNLAAGGAITRCPKTEAQDGVQRGVRFDANDRLCLDGQRLMTLPGLSYGANGSYYRTEIESFARIKQTGADLGSGGVCFTVEQKDGTKLTYGCRPANHCATAGSAEPRVRPGAQELSWLLSRVEDRAGNYMDYCYTKFGSGESEVLLSRIDYTGHTSGSLVAPDRSVRLSYLPRPTGGRANDASSSWMLGGEVRQTQRLDKVTTYAPGQSQPVRTYTMDYFDPLFSAADYSYYSGRSLLRRVKVCGYDAQAAANGMNPEACLPETEFTWSDGNWQYASRKLTVDIPPSSPDPAAPATEQGRAGRSTPAFKTNWAGVTGDLDGDGAREMWSSISGWNGTAWYTESRLVKVNADRVTQGTVRLDGVGGEPIDIDGDGISELFSGTTIYKWKRGRGAPVCDGGAVNCVGSASSHFWNVPTNLPVGALGGTVRFDHKADFNGDGALDVLLYFPSGSSCSLTPQAGTGNADAKLCLFPNLRPGPIGASTTSFAFGAPIEVARMNMAGLGESLSAVIDFDGNGLADVVINDNLGRINRIVRSYRADDGSLSFAAVTAVALNIHHVDDMRWMDINGDGLDDLVSADTSGGATCAGYRPNDGAVTLESSPSNNCYGNWMIQVNKGDALAPVTQVLNPVSGRAPGLRYDMTRGTSPHKVFRYTSKMIQTDVDADGRADLLYPAKFAARMCYPATLTPDEMIRDVDGGEPNGGCVANQCQATVCAPPPPEDGDAYQFHPLGPASYQSANPFAGNNSVNLDPSLYRYNAIRFVQIGDNVFRAQVDETPVVAAGTFARSAEVDDFYGDGLSDVTSAVSCPFRPTAGWTYGCELQTGANIGPGSPTSFLDSAQTIRLGDLVDSSARFYLINENQGDGARGANLPPMLPDLLVRATNGLGDFAQWDYFPLSSAAGRAAGTDFPLYRIDAGYVDERHFLFQSSMPVVSVLMRPNGASKTNVFGGRTVRYAYEGAMYNTAGRGLQGFRQISSETVAAVGTIVRSVTRFHQKFPLTGLIEQQETRVPSVAGDNGRLSLLTNDWRCDRNNRSTPCPGQPGAAAPAVGAIHWPYLSSSAATAYDLGKAELGQSKTVSRVDTLNYADGTNAAGWSEWGNLTDQRVITKDGDGTASNETFVAQHEVKTVNTYDKSLGALTEWWLDKLTRSDVTRSVSYHAREGGTPPGLDLSAKTLRSDFTWNAGTRTSATTTVTDTATGVAVTTTNGYPSVNSGSPTSVTLTGTNITPARESRTTLTTDQYFVSQAIGVVDAAVPARNHVMTTVTRARDGQVESATDANGLVTAMTYDPLGHAVRTTFNRNNGFSLSPSANTSMRRCAFACTGSGEEVAVYFANAVSDGSPSVRTWFDILGREVKKATRSADGRWVNVATKYDAVGNVQQKSAPYFDTQTPLWTQFTYDRLARPLTKRVPTSELNATQGDTLTNYRYDALRVEVEATLADASKCSAAPNLCFTARRYSNALGEMVQTRDALSGVTDFWFGPSKTAAAIRDARGSLITATYNAFGHRLASVDPNQGAWSFTYNALGELLTQTDARGVQTTVSVRDGLGRMLEQRTAPPAVVPANVTAERTLDTWDYDTAGIRGELAAVTRRRSSATGTPDGTLPVWKESYEYELDSARLSRRRTEIPQAAPAPLDLTYQYAYDAYYGWPSAVTYPNLPQPLTVWKRYSRYGALSSLTDARLMTPMWSMSEVDVYGNPTRQQLGYALDATASYSRATGQMTAQSWRFYDTPTFTDKIDELNYSYDVRGNLAKQTRKWRRYDVIKGHLNVLAAGVDQYGETSETYRYDALQRLRGVDRKRTDWSNGTWQLLAPTQPSVDYDYDGVGNITRKTDFANTYVYGGNGCGPNAVSSATLSDANGTVQRGYGCDANGNQITEASTGGEAQTRAIVYDASNLPTRIDHNDAFDGYAQGSTTLYDYGPGNVRYQRRSGALNFAQATETIQSGADGYEQEVSLAGHILYRVELGPVVYTRLKKKQANGSYIADPAVTDYYLRDRLGSTLGVADRWGHFNGRDTTQPITADGLLRRSYDPFGSPRNAALGNLTTLPTLKLDPASRRGFTEHEHLDVAKLIHMNGRGYDYRSGRFLSVDPLVQAPSNSQSHNPYSYIFNNPLSGSDPSGYMSCSQTNTDDAEVGTNCTMMARDSRSANKLGTMVTVVVGEDPVARSAAVSVGVMRNGADTQQDVSSAGSSKEPADIGSAQSPAKTVSRALAPVINEWGDRAKPGTIGSNLIGGAKWGFNSAMEIGGLISVFGNPATIAIFANAPRLEYKDDELGLPAVLEGATFVGPIALRAVKAFVPARYLLRSGNFNARGFTPKPSDWAFSTFENTDSIKKGAVHVLDSAKMPSFCKICDNPFTRHVSVFPWRFWQIPAWKAARETGVMHPLTEELMKARVDNFKIK